MKKLIIALCIAAMLGVGAALAASKPLLTFGTGDVSTKGTDVRILNDSGEYGGVFRQQKPSKKLTNVVFRFVSNGDVQGGAPRWSIPISTDGNNDTTEGYAFLDAANCGAVVGTNVNPEPTVVSTRNENCRVFFWQNVYPNWAAFAEANPGYVVAHDYAFVIADVAGDYHVYNVHFYK